MTFHISPIAKAFSDPLLKADPTDAAIMRRIDELTRSFEPAMRKAFLDAVKELQGRIDLKALETALKAGNLDDALRVVNNAIGNNSYRGLADQVRGSFIAGGELAAAVAREFQPDNLDIAFDVLNPNTADWLRTYEFGLIRELDRQTRETVADTLRRTIIEGENPLNAARDVRASIGLTRRQEMAVRNYRRMLEETDTEALSRGLRDRRFDPSLRRAARTGEPLSREKIDRMVERYREKYLKHRSENIARTESIRAVQAGNYYAWKRMVDEGVIDATKVRRKWVYTADGRTRHAHITIPSMNPEGVGLDQPFNTELGPLLYPGDPSGTAANTINCRCSVITRMIR